jgi:hypothetical protein
MGLVNGHIEDDGYHGEAECDLCGRSQEVIVNGAEITGHGPTVPRQDGGPTQGRPEWRSVAFKYRPWVACSNECEATLKVIKDREIAKDKEGGTESWKIRSQVRPHAIPGTIEDRS